MKQSKKNVADYFQFNRNSFIYFLFLLAVEIFIATFIDDQIIRPFLGDVLVVILIFCLLRAFLTASTKKLAIGTVVFAYSIEFSQYFNLVEKLQLDDNRIARVVLGSTFDWFDLLSYSIGIVIIFTIKILIERELIKAWFVEKSARVIGWTLFQIATVVLCFEVGKSIISTHTWLPSVNRSIFWFSYIGLFIILSFIANILFEIKAFGRFISRRLIVWLVVLVILSVFTWPSYSFFSLPDYFVLACALIAIVSKEILNWIILRDNCSREPKLISRFKEYSSIKKSIGLLTLILLGGLVSLFALDAYKRLKTRYNYHLTEACDYENIQYYENLFKTGTPRRRIEQKLKNMNHTYSKLYQYGDYMPKVYSYKKYFEVYPEVACPESGRAYCGYDFIFDQDRLMEIVSGHPCF